MEGAAGKDKLREDVGLVGWAPGTPLLLFLSCAFSIIFTGWCVDICWKGYPTWISLKSCSLFLRPNGFLSQWLYKCSICDVIVLFQIFFPKLKTRVIQNIRDNGLNVTLCMTNSLFPEVCISFSYLVVYLWLEVEAPKVGGCTVKRTERWRELLLL